MIYSRDLWIQLPTKDLYNTQVMMAAVNAAKDMYDKGQKRLDDFYEKYGDFMSPFSKDMDRYGQLVLGITNPIEDMYAQGIDPLRSAEGRALVNRLVNSFPIQEMNKMKSNAKMGYKYLEEMGKLLAEGKYSPEQEKFYLLQAGLPSFEDFSTAQYGEWGRMSPVQEQRLFDLVNPMVKDIKASLLNKDQVESLGYKYNPALDYTGVSEDMLSRAITNGIPGLAGTFGEQFFREKAKQELIANGNINPTQDEITKQFQKDALTSVSSMLGIRDQSVNPIWKAQQDRMNARISAGSRTSNSKLKPDFSHGGNVMGSAWSKMLGLSEDGYNEKAVSGGLNGVDVFNTITRRQNNGVLTYMKNDNTNQLNAAKSYIKSIMTQTNQSLNDTWRQDKNYVSAANSGRFYTYDTVAANLSYGTALTDGKGIVTGQYKKKKDGKTGTYNSELSPSKYDKALYNNYVYGGGKIAATGNVFAAVMSDGRIHTFLDVVLTRTDDEGHPYKKEGCIDMGITSPIGEIDIDPKYRKAVFENDVITNKSTGALNVWANGASE